MEIGKVTGPNTGRMNGDMIGITRLGVTIPRTGIHMLGMKERDLCQNSMMHRSQNARQRQRRRPQRKMSPKRKNKKGKHQRLSRRRPRKRRRVRVRARKLRQAMQPQHLMRSHKHMMPCSPFLCLLGSGGLEFLGRRLSLGSGVLCWKLLHATPTSTGHVVQRECVQRTNNKILGTSQFLMGTWSGGHAWQWPLSVPSYSLLESI